MSYDFKIIESRAQNKNAKCSKKSA